MSLLSRFNLFLVFFLFFSSLTAQVNIDIQGGISNTNILSDKNQNANFRTDLNVFAGTSFRLEGEELVGIQLDVLYEQKGTNYIDEQYQSSFRLQYITLCPLANFDLSESFSILVGPYFSYRFRESHDIGGIQMTRGRSDYLSTSDDVGLRSGFRYNFDQFFFQVSYSFGLTDIRGSNQEISYEGPLFPEGLYNKSFSVGLGFTFQD